MAFRHTIGRSWASGGLSLSASKAYTASAEYNFTEEILAVADTEVACVIAVAEIASIFIVCDEDILLEVNDAGGGGGSIALLADEPYVWHTDAYFANEFGVNITALFFTNTSGNTATVQFRCLVDSTP